MESDTDGNMITEIYIQMLFATKIIQYEKVKTFSRIEMLPSGVSSLRMR